MRLFFLTLYIDLKWVVMNPPVSDVGRLRCGAVSLSGCLYGNAVQQSSSCFASPPSANFLLCSRYAAEMKNDGVTTIGHAPHPTSWLCLSSQTTVCQANSTGITCMLTKLSPAVPNLLCQQTLLPLDRNCSAEAQCTASNTDKLSPVQVLPRNSLLRPSWMSRCNVSMATSCRL